MTTEPMTTEPVTTEPVTTEPVTVDDLVEGDTVEVVVGAPAHGGHCVARLGGEHGRVVFVRHALPGERVTAVVTELHRGYLRADAIEIHEASPDRVTPPCAYAKPGLCGGCDLQHVSDDAQLDWKTAIVREQLSRLGGIESDVRVERLPGGLLGWRSRVRYAVDAADRPGLLKHRSHEVVAIDRCLIAHPHIQELDVLARRWPSAGGINAVASTGGDVSVLAHRAAGSESPTDDAVWLPAAEPPARAANPGPSGATGELIDGPAEVREIAAGREWTVPVEGFWQVHPAAADTLVDAVLELLRPEPGETAWDLYGGAGLFAAALAGRTGARVSVVESAPGGVAAARRNLASSEDVEVVAARVETALRKRRITGPVDLVVLDPPRTGAGAEVVRALVAAGPRAIAYVACDPAALGRDVGTFTRLGWKLSAIRAFDCFPMTHHVECVALLTP